MTFRNFTLAAAVTSATALSAYAGEMNDDTIMEKGHSYEDAAQVDSNAAAELEKNIYSENGKDKTSVVISSTDPAEGTSDGVESRKVEALGTLTEQEVVLKAAEPGAMVRTADGEIVGTVSGTRDRGEDGALVLVSVDPAYSWPVSEVAFEVKSLSAIEEGEGLEYDLSFDRLVKDILEKTS